MISHSRKSDYGSVFTKMLPPPPQGNKSVIALLFTSIATLTGAVYYFYLTEVLGENNERHDKTKKK
ncbi:unnamed protein product [Cylicocyclus nassatus]|uniref:Uncharacterized protein n=1 Tax=Cylicocyclus nassatus TaxID=53992 RepID=A0AA36GQ16_CYLNA|nr:unnamed protein product [Cylicocyclus nassatus]